jgi:hypothetical protein
MNYCVSVSFASIYAFRSRSSSGPFFRHETTSYSGPHRSMVPGCPSWCAHDREVVRIPPEKAPYHVNAATRAEYPTWAEYPLDGVCAKTFGRGPRGPF